MLEAVQREVLASYFRTHGVVRHQIESFDHFADEMLRHIITEDSDVVVTVDSQRHVVSFGKVCIPAPTTKEASGFVRTINGPAEAMARSLTYASAVLVDVDYRIYEDAEDGGDTCVRHDIYREVVLCKLPIMVRSAYCFLSQRPGDMSSCIYDSGGYFVINGLEKTLIAQQKLRTNTAFVWPGRPPSRALFVCEVRSCHERKLRSTSTLCLHLNPGDADHPPQIMAQLPFITKQVPISTLFTLLGCETADEMVAACGDGIETLARTIITEGSEPGSREELLVQLGVLGTTEATEEKRRRYIDHILSSEVLPHMGLQNDAECMGGKVLYLGHMIRRLLLVFSGRRECDDRDNFTNKRVDAPGHLMSLLFRQLFRAHLKGLHSAMHRALSTPHKQLNLPKLILARKLTAGFKFAFATGNWGVQARLNTAQNGVAQVLNRNSIFASLADKRRIALQAKRESKNATIRQLHQSAWGIVCPCESPEGASCGLIVNLAALAHVRINSCDQKSFAATLLRLPPALGYRAACSCAEGRTRVFHNGVIHGFVPNARAGALCTTLRELRSANVLPFDASVSHDATSAEVHVGTDAGCLCRPVYAARRTGEVAAIMARCDAQRRPLWPALVDEGVVVYIDKDEEKELLIAERAHALAAEHTHAEIHPSAILGMGAAMIPFAHHNQAPRNTYQCAMGKQSIGCYASNTITRLDTYGFGLWYPQRPLVGTVMEDILGTKEIPAGTNAIVAIMTYTGYNQEDSLIFNQASLQRGMMRCTVTRTMRDEIGGEGYSFCRPDSSCDSRRASCYDAVRECGTVPVGTRVARGDIVIGKVQETTVAGKARRSDCSTLARCASDGTVDRVLQSTNRDGLPLRKVRIRETREPQEGDKFTSRHGQKGVIGARLPPEDMPFTADGIQPDIIMNPHALPSRMTVGQLVEMLLSALCCHEGRIGDGTAFGDVRVEDIAQRLEDAGLDRHGCHRMFNGTTGEPLEAEIFMAPVCMQSLKHMVEDKCHARKSGPVDAKTRQPLEGRAKDGGLRFGEMERDCVGSHGMSAFMNERLFTQSDPYCCSVCAQCGMFAEDRAGQHPHAQARPPFCRRCDTGEHVKQVGMPYATKLFLQEVMAMNIAPELTLENT